MTLQIAPELAALLQAEAQRSGITAEDLALGILWQRVMPPVSLSEPIDDRERGLHAIAASHRPMRTLVAKPCTIDELPCRHKYSDSIDQRKRSIVPDRKRSGS